VEPIIFLAVLIQNTCTKQSSFAVTLIAEYSIKLNYCGVLSLQTSIGNFYTSNGGPTGTGKILAGTNITTNQTVYYYAVVKVVYVRMRGYQYHSVATCRCTWKCNYV
jgi:hypothetical protein